MSLDCTHGQLARSCYICELESERDRLAAENAELRKAAQAVIDRWDTPLWKDVPSTAEYIGRLRAALAKKENQNETR